MKIVHIAAEFAPIAKAGGLGEMVVGLCRELTRKGHNVQVFLPKYDFIDLSKLENLKIEMADFKCLGFANAMWAARAQECDIRLLEARHPAGYFHRGNIYGFEDDVPRFLYFSRAVLEYLKLKNEPIDVLHLHDWHVSIAAVLVKDLLKEIKVKKIVLSIHNIEYQGKCAIVDLNAIGMEGQRYLTKERLQDDNPKFSQTINLLKGGIVYADAIVPVSKSYAQEILTPAYSFGLHQTLVKMQSKIYGIINGIDQKLWDPRSDEHLNTTYDVESALKGKQKNRELLQKRFNIDAHKRPWIGTITRLVPQKGPELIEAALKKTLELDGTFLLLGSSPVAAMQKHFNELKEKYAGNRQVVLQMGYDETLAHLLYAALDFLVVPSLFEPCGLTQMIAMRYGTIPIVRATGGLKDTVFDCENPQIPVEKRNGFVFINPHIADVHRVLERAVLASRTEEGIIKSLIVKDMKLDFGWEKPAQEYLKLYTRQNN